MEVFFCFVFFKKHRSKSGHEERSYVSFKTKRLVPSNQIVIQECFQLDNVQCDITFSAEPQLGLKMFALRAKRMKKCVEIPIK